MYDPMSMSLLVVIAISSRIMRSDSVSLADEPKRWPFLVLLAFGRCLATLCWRSREALTALFRWLACWGIILIVIVIIIIIFVVVTLIVLILLIVVILLDRLAGIPENRLGHDVCANLVPNLVVFLLRQSEVLRRSGVLFFVLVIILLWRREVVEERRLGLLDCDGSDLQSIAHQHR
jgi:hypothetical protein